MGFANLNREIYEKMKKKRYGYICPECGNLESMVVFVRQVERMVQNIKTGIVEIIELDDRLEGQEREVVEVQCGKCGAIAEECKKGFKIDDNAEVD
jgi:predicted RNA-binding Zn-ribbon protein involved in translation (DUF1610 family)